ncbi:MULTISPECIES: hypothetical protein [unclassified Streptomyces]|uniref:hypothetical protein n=1 Tax=unclassified Streptomyces TaxID=2593676 RepID=UPI002481E4CF|nr:MULTISPECIES: hypothetical protein [unclassified Streptomyces]MDA5279018.1 hypothetical protein [Streptomyces sp. Isolate_45]MDX2395364.1 hypothetical protein [Streptomyces sp. DK15]
MRTHHTVLTLAAAAGLLVLTGCAEVAPVESKPASLPVAAKPSATQPSAPQSPAAKAPAAKPSAPSADPAAARAAAGLPAAPEGAARQAFIGGLDAIDRDIVHGKEDKAIGRGVNTCSAIKNHPGDRAKQIEQTEQRWTSPTHPEGHGAAKAARILDVAHKNICPTF